MSRQELNALKAGLSSTPRLRSTSRLRSGRANATQNSERASMSGAKSQESEQTVETLQTELERLRAELQCKDKELEEFKASVTIAESKLTEVTQLADERLEELEYGGPEGSLRRGWKFTSYQLPLSNF